MSANQDAPAEEIIIVRRKGGGEDDCHHGGVWKIAYADFMTAMMAFFLVMWLINAANTEVKASVASYFNPLRLTDNMAVKKGLRDMTEKAKSDEGAPDKQEKSEKSEKSSKEDKSEKDAGAHPTPAKRIVLQFDKEDPAVKREESQARSASAELKGQAFRDPFNPLAPGSLVQEDGTKASAGPSEGVSGRAWSKSLKRKTEELAALDLQRQAAPSASETAPTPAPDSESRQPITPAHAPENTDGATKLEGRLPVAAGGAVAGPDAASAEKSETEKHAVLSPPGAAEAGKAEPSEPASKEPSAAERAAAAEAARMIARRDEVKARAAEAIRSLGVNGGPGMDVTIEGDAVVLSLTDTASFGMFSIGSSDPRQELLGLMQSIAPLVLANSEQVIIRGHTDGRPYRADSVNNNWRLSMMRAEAAFELLRKAGVDEARFERIEGYADRKLKTPTDPEGAANRRIEIVLRPKKS